MIYILMFTVLFPEGPMHFSTEFNTKGACMAAGMKYEEQFRDKLGTEKEIRALLICVRKGAPQRP